MIVKKGELSLGEKRITLQASLFTLVDGTLFYIDPNQERSCPIVSG